MTTWSPASWQTRVAQQQATYGDPTALARIVDEIGRLPPLVTSWEVEKLREQLARAARGDAFLLQGGDCAESFDDCRAEPIAAKLKILLQMSLVLVHGTRKQVIRVGRIAGQYAKPRSADTEKRGDVTLPAYRGDIINRDGFTAEDRDPDPQLMLRAYERAALTLNFIRALVDGGFADLHHPEYWDVSFAKGSPNAEQYVRIVDAIRESLHFVSAITGVESEVLRRVDVYTSHEALALPYEQAQTRTVPRRAGYYNDPADRDLLTPGGRTIVETPNAGGSSIYSEVFAFEQLARCEMAGLLKTETQIVYDTTGKITDILVTIDGRKIGVSVVRAVQFPFGTPYTLSNATTTLTKKLEDIQQSSMNVSAQDKWVKQVLAVVAYDQQHADTVEQAWLGLSASVKADTVVVVTATHGDDTFIYTNQ